MKNSAIRLWWLNLVVFAAGCGGATDTPAAIGDGTDGGSAADAGSVQEVSMAGDTWEPDTGLGAGDGGAHGDAVGTEPDTSTTPDTQSPDMIIESDHPHGFACDPNAQPEAVPLRRLTVAQYRNSVADVLGFAMPEWDAELIETEDGADGWLLEVLDHTLRTQMPRDVRRNKDKHGGFRRLDQDVHQAHVDTYYAIAAWVGEELSAWGRFEAFAGPCAQDDLANNDGMCVEDAIRRLGERAFRRPLDESEIAQYLDIYGTNGIDADAWSDVVTVMLASPQFVYVLEHGADTDTQAAVATLTAHELAARLSYHFWQAPPDETLRALADSGALLDPEVFSAEVDRLFSDPRTDHTLRAFFQEYLWLDDVPELDSRVGTPVFDAFRGSFEPTWDTREHLIDEALEMAVWYARHGAGGIEALFTTDRSFARHADVAELYGAPIWDGVSEPPLAPGPRRGLLTRGALLASGTANTRPIMKGVFIRIGLLCDDLEPPPDNAAAAPPDLSPDLTTREVVEELTEQPESTCIGCHRYQINPLGFATENFDALGRFRTHQALFTEWGAPLGEKAVDTTGVPYVEYTNDTEISGVEELSELMLDSGKPQACFATNYFRFTHGRLEDTALDGCTLEAIRQVAHSGGTIADIWKAIALAPSFRERSFVEVQQ